MRKIKFRVWDKTANQFIPQNLLKDMFFSLVNLPEGVEQFTGLVDKNGIEIYEGDIITDYRGDKREVKFIDGGFWVNYPDGTLNMPSLEYREIVGNIFENKKLIK